MSEDTHPAVMAMDVHEDFLEHIEKAGGKIRALSIVTVVVALLLALSYAAQLLVLPFILGVTSQTVDLLDPGLMALEAGLLVLTLAWLYVGLRDYAFTTRLAGQAREIRALQARLEKRIEGGGTGQRG